MILSILANRKNSLHFPFPLVFRSQRLLNYMEVSFIKICKQWRKLVIFGVMMIVKNNEEFLGFDLDY